MAKTEKAEHEFYPLIDGASVPLRGYEEKVTPTGAEGRMDLTIAYGDGLIDGVKFGVAGTVGCSLRVVFQRPGDPDEHTYFVKVTDFIRAAFEADKRRHGRKS
jgi:hypothetical protein